MVARAADALLYERGVSGVYERHFTRCNEGNRIFIGLDLSLPSKEHELIPDGWTPAKRRDYAGTLWQIVQLILASRHFCGWSRVRGFIACLAGSGS